MKKVLLTLVLALGIFGVASAQMAAPSITMNEAMSKVQTIIETGYKGYRITDIEQISSHKGGGYEVEAEKTLSRDMKFYVSPTGEVTGPLLD